MGLVQVVVPPPVVQVATLAPAGILTTNVPGTSAVTTACTARPSRHCRSTAAPPLTRMPWNEPSAHEVGKAGSK